MRPATTARRVARHSDHQLPMRRHSGGTRALSGKGTFRCLPTNVRRAKRNIIRNARRRCREQVSCDLSPTTRTVSCSSPPIPRATTTSSRGPVCSRVTASRTIAPPTYHSGILGFSDSGAFLGDYQSCRSVSYFWDASGPLIPELEWRGELRNLHSDYLGGQH